jgi:hypothetical protein
MSASRRDFLRLIGSTSAAAATSGAVIGLSELLDPEEAVAGRRKHRRRKKKKTGTTVQQPSGDFNPRDLCLAPCTFVEGIDGGCKCPVASGTTCTTPMECGPNGWCDTTNGLPGRCI